MKITEITAMVMVVTMVVEAVEAVEDTNILPTAILTNSIASSQVMRHKAAQDRHRWECVPFNQAINIKPMRRRTRQLGGFNF